MNSHAVIDEKIKQILCRISSFSLAEILEVCDTKILYAKLDEETGGFTVSNNRCHTVVINRDYSEFMQTFIILHEIGHLKLHKGVSTPFYRNLSIGSFIPTIEREANEFALKMLISMNDEFDIYGLLDEIGLPYSMISCL